MNKYRFTDVSGQKTVRSALALGAGGVLGGAWMAGALHALAERTRWYPRHADYLVGTSAGSVLATLGAAGVPPWLLIPESAANVYHAQIDASGNLQVERDLWQRIVRRNRLSLPRLAPGSLSLTLACLGQGRWAFLKAISGLAPAGFISTDPIKDTVRWVDYQTGDRVVFGQEGSPTADVAQAVAASCAIPGYYCPEEIDGRLYVDGALHSMSNLDLLLGLKLDLVVVISPHSTRQKFHGWDPLNRFTDATRRVAARQVDAEVAALRAEGTEVLLLEPMAEDLAAIGGNVMNERRRGRVMRTATRTTLEQLERPEVRNLVLMLERPLPPADSPAPARAKPRLRPAI
jgi:NTE family protein